MHFGIPATAYLMQEFCHVCKCKYKIHSEQNNSTIFQRTLYHFYCQIFTPEKTDFNLTRYK